MGDARRRRWGGSQREGGSIKVRRALRAGALVAGLALLVAAPAVAAIAAHSDYGFAGAKGTEWKTTNQSIVITATGVEATPTIHYSLDGGATTYTAEQATTWTAGGDATFTVNVTTEGTHEFKYQISQEGTISAVATQSPGWVNLDKSAPVTTATADGRVLASSPTSAWWDASATVTMVATDTLSGVAANYPTYRVNEGNLSIYEFPFVIEKQGSTKITYQSVDKAGNVEGTVTGYVNIDETAPSLEVKTTPKKASGWYSTDVTVELVATDAVSGVDHLQYRESNATTWTATTGTFVLTSPANAGAHSYRCQAIDKAGNVAQQDITVNIDKVGPTTLVQQKTARVNRPVKLSYKATDGISPQVIKVSIKVRNSRNAVVTSFYLDPKLVGKWYTVTWVPRSVGTFTYSLFARDLALNAPVKIGVAKIIVRR
jgi:hypothetical protein